MANASKQKGNTFERKIAKLFSDKFNHMFEGKDAFRRNLTSGGYFGGSNANRKDSIIADHHIDVGDIMTPPNFKYTLECKFYKTPPTFNSLIKGNAIIDKWLEQAKLQSEVANKPFMIIAKWNDVQEVCIFETNLKGIPYKEYIIIPLNTLLEQQPIDFWFVV